MHGYHERRVHEQGSPDLSRRVQAATKLLEIANSDPTFLERIVWTDEAKFELSGAVNLHNAVYWSRSNPRQTVETKRVNQQGITIWAGIWSSGRVGPIEIEGRLTATEYLRVLEEQIIPSLGDTSNLYFMQDGAPSHTANVVKAFLRHTFGDRVISLGWDPEWPPRSPDT